MIRLACLALLMTAAPLAARDSLGVFDGWAAFRDASPKRCYAIAKPRGSKSQTAFASVATWPDRKVRGQVHFSLSRPAAEKAKVRLRIGSRDFSVVAKGRNAWAPDAKMDAAIIAALRSASAMNISTRSAAGGSFTDRYALAGAASAMDAASVGCAERRR
jgi:hypothetical protein